MRKCNHLIPVYDTEIIFEGFVVYNIPHNRCKKMSGSSGRLIPSLIDNEPSCPYYINIQSSVSLDSHAS